MKLKHKITLISITILILAFVSLWLGTQKTALDFIMDYQHKISLVNIEKQTQQIEQDIKNGKHALRIISRNIDPNNLNWADISHDLYMELETSVFDRIGLVYSDKSYNITGSSELGDLSDRQYLDKVFEGKTVVSDPILAKDRDEDYQIVIAFPIMYNSQVKGALVGVIPVVDIANHIYGLNIGGKGEGILTNTSADLIIHSDNKNLTCPSFFDTIGIEGFVGRNGYIPYEDCEGEDSYMFFKKLEETGLVALITVKERDLHQPIANIFNKNFRVFILVLLAALIITDLVIKAVLAPIERLIAAMKKVEQGDYTLQIPEGKHDEIGEIAVQFNKTLEAISLRDEELQALNEELSSSFEELNETNDRLLEACDEVARRLQNEKVINSLSEMFYGEKDLDELLKVILIHTREIINSDRCAVYFYNEDKDIFQIVEAINFKGHERSIVFEKDEGTIGWIVENKEELVITDIRTDSRFKPKYSWSRDIGMLLQIPILDEKERVVGVISYIGEDLNLNFTPYLKQLSKTISITIQNSNLISEVKGTYFDIVRALVKAMELKDTYTRGHSERVMEYSLMLGEKLNLPPKELEILKHGSILHDIGKLAIPDDILLKPGKLNSKEYNEIKKHSEKGMEFIEGLEFLKPALSIIRHHHERIDGKGYPDGLKGDQIEKLTKIVTIADAYDAITSRRSYKKPLTKEAAIEELLAHKGTQFDPYLVEKFVEVISEV